MLKNQYVIKEGTGAVQACADGRTQLPAAENTASGGAPREDRRSRRSKRLLKQGLLELMKSKRFNEISARNITDRMDLNRGTFYLHYTDTTELLQSIEDDLENDVQELIDSYMETSVSTLTLRPVFEPVVDFIIEKYETCSILFNNNAVSNFTGRLQQLIYRNGITYVHARYDVADEEQMLYLLSFVTFGIIGLIAEWFNEGMKIPKDRLIEMADAMLTGAAEKFYSIAADNAAPDGVISAGGAS